MTLLEFIKLKLDEDTPVGDIARDSQRDKEFMELTTDKERLSHLEWATANVSEFYEEFLEKFNSVK